MLIPLSNNLLLEPIEKETPGFIIPDTAKKGRAATGRVVATGPDVKHLKMGDVVLIKGYMVDDIEIDDKKYLVGQEEAIIGKITELK